MKTTLNKKLLLFSLVITVIPILIISAISFSVLKNTISTEILDKRQLLLSEEVTSVNIVLDKFKGQTLNLGDLPPVQGIIRARANNGVDPFDGSTLEVWKSRFQTALARAIEVDSTIDHIRFIDENGDEVVRVNNLEGAPQKVPESKLENKGDREYFKRTMQFQNGDVFISELDLNVENGGIEVPHKPVIRFATPVFNTQTNEREGIIAMNVRSSFILDLVGEKQLGETILTDQDGYFLINSAEKEKEFGLQLSPSDSAPNYFEEQPELKLNTEELDSKFHHDIEESEYRIWQKVFYNSEDKGKHWIVFNRIDEKVLFSPVNDLRNLFFLIGLIFLCLTAGASILLTRNISRPIEELHGATKKLGEGDFDLKINLRGTREMEELADSFNSTAEILRKRDEEHKQIDKAKTEFLSITSHELRSPMTPMQAQLQMLLKEYFGKINKKQRDALEIVLRNTKRLDNIIQDFLEISRAEAGRLKFNFVKTNIREPISRLVKEMSGFLPEKKIKIETKISELPEIQADPDRIMQILRNLINNSKKFSPENSTITITAQQKGNMIQFSVSDQGIGIPLEAQAKLFTPFYQVDNMYQRKSGGTGLGLAICKGIIESQNGRIWIRSIPKKGTTFYFTLPLEPVREAKPIKLLFSNKENVDNSVKNLYKEFLGPMGESEFNRIAGNLKPATIFSNVNELESEKILTNNQANRFRDSVMGLFRKQESFIKNKGSNELLKKSKNNPEERIKKALKK